MEQKYVNDICTESDKLEIYLFNVGQGDHMLLKFPNYEFGIIDFHYDVDNDIVEPPSLSYFKQLKNQFPEEFKRVTIKFLCISHTDKDHIKGISDVLGWFKDNDVFVEDIWLSAAKDESQLTMYLQTKFDSIWNSLDISSRISHTPVVNSFQGNINMFFDYFNKWKDKKFSSTRYQNEKIGLGEYLIEIRPIGGPGVPKNCTVINMGPLTSQLDSYFNSLTWEILKKTLKIRDNNKLDKNLLSHILKIRFGETNLLFGGDTHERIWIECLDRYDDLSEQFSNFLGNYDSQFIKVSHHGSKNSSNIKLWERIVPKQGPVHLGISAGRHEGYNHPDSETLTHIRETRNDCIIHCTNVCSSCLLGSPYDKEHHVWYDNFIQRKANYGKQAANKNDLKIGYEMERSFGQERQATNDLGLFAYIIQVPLTLNEEISVRVALSSAIAGRDCFYKNREVKLCDGCIQTIS